MFKIEKLPKSLPDKYFFNLFEEAYRENQQTIDVMVVSSFSKELNQTHSRYVNLKIIKNGEFIFFSNYEGQKARDFIDNNRVSCLLYWNKIDTQIRMNGTIKKTSSEFSNKYFNKRERNKNILAISSNQSKKIKSYQDVLDNYKRIEKTKNKLRRPSYWGGYSFKPFYFEFWQGHSSRINKRQVFKMNPNKRWTKYFLEP